MVRSYSELIRLNTFEERYEYLRLDGEVGVDTFGFDRIFNQRLYRSTEWRQLRDKIIVRDNGCDLGVEGHEIYGHRIIIHHINPITLTDIERHSPILFDPENLITTIHSTHNAIHYGDAELLVRDPIVRTKYDTCPWRR